MGVNQFFGIGRLTKDVDLKYNSNNLAIAKFTLAIDRPKRKDQEKAEVDYINVVAFGKLGEFASKYFSKGKRVFVLGRIQIDAVEKDGKKTYYTNIVAEKLEFADGNTSNGNTQNATEGFTNIVEDDDTIPFT